MRRGLNYLCQNAIDGDVNTHFRSKPYVQDPKQWLGIKLDDDYYITQVVFYTYAGNVVTKMEGLEVRAGLTKVFDNSQAYKLTENALVGEQDGTFENGRSYYVIPDAPIKACYLSFQNMPTLPTSALAISEIEIYGYKAAAPPPPKKRRCRGRRCTYKN